MRSARDLPARDPLRILQLRIRSEVAEAAKQNARDFETLADRVRALPLGHPARRTLDSIGRTS